MAVQIDIVGNFKGKKAFKDANSSLGGLESAAKKMGLALAAAFSTDKIISFSKESISAFMADQKAAGLLANQLKNIGYTSATKQAEIFIATMQSQTGVLDDELRPAYSQLARVTGSLEKTQKLMALAFDVSNGTGQDYLKTIDILSQAYVGNRKGLKSLNTGLTQVELKTKSFTQIVDFLSKKFAGAGAAALDTYAGKVALLEVSVANAKETIGKGFIDAFSQIANDGDFKNVTSTIDDMAQNVADTLVGIGAILGKIRTEYNAIPDWLKAAAKSGFRIAAGPLGLVQELLAKEGSKTSVRQSMPSGITNFLEEHNANQTRMEEKRIQDEQRRNNAKLLALQKSANKLALNNLKLQKAAATFDMKKIQITAALKSATDEETITRLKLMLAIENEQGDVAEKLQKKLDEIIAKNKTLAADLSNIKNEFSTPFADPFVEWRTGIYKTIDDVGLLQSKVTELTGVALNNSIAMLSFTQGIASGLSTASALSGARYAAQGAAQYAASGGAPIINITVNGAIDPVSTANQINQTLAQAAGTTGSYDSLGINWTAALGLTP